MKLFKNKDCELLFYDNERTIKAYRDDKNNVVYIFDKKDHIMKEDILPFQRKKGIQKIIEYYIFLFLECCK